MQFRRGLSGIGGCGVLGVFFEAGPVEYSLGDGSLTSAVDGPRRPRESPMTAQEAPQDGPRGLADRPSTAQEDPMRAPRPMESPSWPREGPKSDPTRVPVFGHARVETIGRFVCSPLLNPLSCFLPPRSKLQAPRLLLIAPLASLPAPLTSLLLAPRSSLLAPHSSRTAATATNHATA